MTDSVNAGAVAVVWDLDGTLVDSAADIAASLNRLLAEVDLPSLDDDRIRDMIGEGVRTLIRRGLAAHQVTPDDGRLDDLVERFLADDLRGDLIHDVLNGFQDALPEIAASVSIAELERFVLTGGGSGRNGRPAACASHQFHIDFDGGIAS